MKKGNTLGIVLIIIGAAWIIRQTGILAINWSQAYKALPIFLIAFGVSMMVGHRKRIAVGVWILAFVLFAGFGIYKQNEAKDLNKEFLVESDTSSKVQKQPVDNEILLVQGTEKGKLIIQMGAAEIGVTNGENNLLVKLNSNIPKLQQRLVQGKQAVVEYSHEQSSVNSSGRKFKLEMNPTLLWNVDASLGAVDGKLDFSNIPLESLELKLGAGALDLIVGNQQIHTNVVLRAGAADLNIYVPEGAGIRVNAGNLITDLSFRGIDMEYRDKTYYSENYEQAEQKIEIDVQTAVSVITIMAK